LNYHGVIINITKDEYDRIKDIPIKEILGYDYLVYEPEYIENEMNFTLNNGNDMEVDCIKYMDFLSNVVGRKLVGEIEISTKEYSVTKMISFHDGEWRMERKEIP
jgi:hypothetical protein